MIEPPTDAELDEIFSSIRSQQSAPQEKSVLQKAGDVALEGMAAVNRGAANIADFAMTPVNAALELSGSNARVPSLTEAISPATAGNFMEPGLAKDVVRGAGEAIPASVAIGSGLRTAAQQLPAMASGAESVGAGALRAMGQSTPSADVGYGALSGAGAAVGQEVGGNVGGMVGAVRCANCCRRSANGKGVYKVNILRRQQSSNDKIYR